MDGLPVLDTLWYCTWWCWISAWLLVLQLHIFVANTVPWTNPTPLTTNLLSLSLYTWLWLKILGPPKNGPGSITKYDPFWGAFGTLFLTHSCLATHTYAYILYYIILYYIILCYIILYYIILCYIISYYILIYSYTCQYYTYTYNFFLGNRTLSTIPAQPQHASTWKPLPLSPACNPVLKRVHTSGSWLPVRAGEWQGNGAFFARVGSSIKTSMWMVKYTLQVIQSDLFIP